MSDTLIKYIGYLIAAAAVMLGCYLAGKNEVQKDWDKAKSEYEQRLTKAEEALKTAQATEVIKYVEKIKYVKVKGDTIVQQVPVLISQQANTQCILTNGFVRLHDAAASNTEIGIGSSDNDDPVNIDLITATKTITANYNTCNQFREQIITLQNILRKIQALGETDK